MRMLPQSLPKYLYISCAMFRGPCFLGNLDYPWLLNSFYLLFQSFLSPEGRDLVETSHLGLSVPRSLSLSAYILAMGLSICFHLLQEETSLMRLSKTLIYEDKHGTMISLLVNSQVVFLCPWESGQCVSAAFQKWPAFGAINSYEMLTMWEGPRVLASVKNSFLSRFPSFYGW